MYHINIPTILSYHIDIEKYRITFIRRWMGMVVARQLGNPYQVFYLHKSN